jgi:hypothetical protein
MEQLPGHAHQRGKPVPRANQHARRMPALIEEFGLPQDWNADGQFGPERTLKRNLDNAPMCAYD